MNNKRKKKETIKMNILCLNSSLHYLLPITYFLTSNLAMFSPSYYYIHLNATQFWYLWTDPHLCAVFDQIHLSNWRRETTQGVCTTSRLPGKFSGAHACIRLYPLHEAVTTDVELWSTSGPRSTQVLAWPPNTNSFTGQQSEGGSYPQRIPVWPTNT